MIAYDRRPPPKARPLSLTPGAPAGGERTLLLATPDFALERWWVRDAAEGRTRATSLEIVTAIDGRGRLRWSGGELGLARGTSVVLPAALGAYELAAAGEGEELTVVRCTIPDLEVDVRRLLRALGYGQEEIDGVVMGSDGGGGR